MNASKRKQNSSTMVAVDTLRDLIFTGDLPAGSDHLETELAEALSLSRTPVREALLVLEAQGLVEIRPRKGVRIKPISPEDMGEIYDILTELESLAAGTAATRDLSVGDLAALEQTINEMDRALSIGDLAAWAKADDTFHTELVRLGGNSRVTTIVAMMSDQVRRARLATLDLRPAPLQSNADHRAVLTAIRSGDAKTARRTHHAHRTAAKTVMIQLIKAYNLKTL
ncbi:MAG: GntR family transcriptional regulator [Pseudomonadota bacterium]